LVLAGSAVLGLLLSLREGPHISAAARPALLLVAFLLVACGEVSERFLFYGLSGRQKDGVRPQ
jgi:DMSO reductase anchor subunit